jgi:predicted RNA binding protein YcfA (HicA-like mRNA interferase family)
MKSVSGKELYKIVESYGWELKIIRGSHHIYNQEAVELILVIPVPGNRDLPVGTLKGIMKDAELSEKDLNI